MKRYNKLAERFFHAKEHEVKVLGYMRCGSYVEVHCMVDRMRRDIVITKGGMIKDSHKSEEDRAVYVTSLADEANGIPPRRLGRNELKKIPPFMLKPRPVYESRKSRYPLVESEE